MSPTFTPPHATIARDGDAVRILDQTVLPFALRFAYLRTWTDAARAIRTMQVRGAPLIGVTAAFGLALAMQEDPSDMMLEAACAELAATRPTAVNLAAALARLRAALTPLPPSERPEAAWALAEALRAEDAALCAAIAEAGLPWLQAIAQRRGSVRVLTHCNAGWVATCGAGTALAPVYLAHEHGLAVHVWVSETRPRNQGLITEWELRQAGVPAALVADNAAAWLLAQGVVDLVIVGADRIAANGDVANKVGTALKAFAAHVHGVPFLVAAPSTTFDAACPTGSAIPIEDRGPEELATLPDAHEPTRRVMVVPDGTRIGPNPGFDVTPARFVTAILTERGAVPPAAISWLLASPKGWP